MKSYRHIGKLLIYVTLSVLFILSAGDIRCQEDTGNDANLPPGEHPPPGAADRLEKAGGACDHEGADYLVVYDKAVNRVKPTGVTYVDRYTLYKILTPAGCTGRSVLRWNYDPQSSHVEIREVNIIRGGERIPVDPSAVHDLPAPQSAIYWSDRIKTLQLPRLHVGDGIEVTIFRKGFTYALLGETETPGDERYIPPMAGEYFDIVIFAGEAPILEKKYILTLPPDKRLHSEVFNGPLYSGTMYTPEKNQYSWWGFDLPARTRERSQPDQNDFVTKVVMTTALDWETKSRWFFDVNRDQFEVTPEIQEKVDEIIAGAGLKKGSEEEKAKVLLHWVAQNIRYSGQTMGEGEGFTLHPGSMIFEQRSGVCKDIAGMLITMMRAAGMNSFAAMTMAGSRIEDLPADQFNHCVCALRKDDGTFEMYDPTWVPYNNSIWSLLEAEQHYLIGTPEGESLSRIPYSPPEESPLKVRHEARLGIDGTLEGRIRLSGSGALDGRLRRIVTSQRRRELVSAVAALLSPVSERVEKITVKHHREDDFSSDMWIDITYAIPRFAPPVSGIFELKSPMMQIVLGSGYLFRAGSSTWPEERSTDVFLYYTQSIDGTEKISLPKGYRAVETPSSKKIDETYAYFSAASSMKDSDLVITQNAGVRRRQIPPAGYEGFVKAMNEARTWSEMTYRIEKGGRR